MTTSAQDFQVFGKSISPHARGDLTAKTRWLLSAGVRMGTVDGCTGRLHGPQTAMPATDCPFVR